MFEPILDQFWSNFWTPNRAQNPSKNWTRNGPKKGSSGKMPQDGRGDAPRQQSPLSDTLKRSFEVLRSLHSVRKRTPFRPRWPQVAQDGPKLAQRGSKIGPRWATWAKMAPKWVQQGFRIAFLSYFCFFPFLSFSLLSFPFLFFAFLPFPLLCFPFLSNRMGGLPKAIQENLPKYRKLGLRASCRPSWCRPYPARKKEISI